MAKLYIINKEGALYKPGTILRRYDEGYVRQQLTPTKTDPSKYTYSDAGFTINHDKLDGYCIPANGKIQFEVTSDGVFAKDDQPHIITHNGRILGSQE